MKNKIYLCNLNNTKALCVCHLLVAMLNLFTIRPTGRSRLGICSFKSTALLTCSSILCYNLFYRVLVVVIAVFVVVVALLSEFISINFLLCFSLIGWNLYIFFFWNRFICLRFMYNYEAFQ